MFRIVFSCLLALQLLAYTLPGLSMGATPEKDILETENSKEINFAPGGTVYLNGFRGELQVITTQEAKVSFEWEFEGDSERWYAKKDLKKSQPEFRLEDNNQTLFIINRIDYREGELLLTVPRKTNLFIVMAHGEVSVTDLIGTLQVTSSAGEISVAQIKGDVQLKTSGGEIYVLDVTGNVNARTAGGEISLNQIDGSVKVKTAGGEIEAQDITGNAELKTAGGEIEARNIGGKLSAATAGGCIQVDTAADVVDIATSGGDLKLFNIAGASTARTSGGDIEGEHISGAVVAKTSGGDLTFRDLKAAITGKTSGGDIDVTLTLTDFSQNHAIDLETSAGDITLSIPKKLPATIEAVIRLSKRKEFWDRYDIFSDFPLTKEKKDDKNGYIKLLGNGSINGGGDPIKLETSVGNIRIKKNN